MKTYQDFEWVVKNHPGIDSSLFVTYVRNSTSDAVIATMTDNYLGWADNLSDGSRRFPEVRASIAAGQLDEWVVAFSDENYVGLDESLMPELSRGRQVLTHSQDVGGHASFFVWENGKRTTYFDPLLLCGFGLDPMPEGWDVRLREVGIDPATGRGTDGQFHVMTSSFAMAANYLDVAITPEFLDSTPFVFGY